MKKRIVATMLMLASCMSLFSGCGKKDLPGNKIETIVTDPNEITKESKITNDLQLLGMGMEETVEDLALSDIEALVPLKKGALIYFSMPEDTKDEVYRVKKIEVNNDVYDVQFLTSEDDYQKYVIKDLKKDENDTYEISEINFVEKKSKEKSSFNIEQEITAKLEKNKYLFEQEYHYSIVLSGQNFESVYQFNKDTNEFVDLWAKVIPCVEKLDEDQRSFYYFAFNCYDPKKDIYFCPDDILRLDVEYNVLSYQYKGKEKEKAENIRPDKKPEKQSIKADTISVLAKDEKRSNKKLYKYKTINNLKDADATRLSESTNAGILAQAQRQYDWAVHFGAKDGYPYKKNKSGWPITEYDIAYSKIEDLKTIKVKYRVNGKHIDTNTASLVVDDEITTEEDDRKPDKPDRYEYDLKYIWDSDNGFIWKVKETAILVLKSYFLWIALGVIAFIVYKVGLKNVLKFFRKIVHKVQDNLDLDD